jgi:zinc-ribbon domain
MYCPQCAAQLVDNDKFCRACGADLKAVAVALVGQQLTSKEGKIKIKAPKKEKTWMEKRSQGMRKAAEGATMLGTSLLLGLAINFLSSHPERMGLWAILFGWIACWGIFSLASGLGSIAQAATMGVKGTQSQPADDPGTVPDTDPLESTTLFPPPSVTEYTTESLGAQTQSSKHPG